MYVRKLMRCDSCLRLRKWFLLVYVIASVSICSAAGRRGDERGVDACARRNARGPRSMRADSCARASWRMAAALGAGYALVAVVASVPDNCDISVSLSKIEIGAKLTLILRETAAANALRTSTLKRLRAVLTRCLIDAASYFLLRFSSQSG